MDSRVATCYHTVFATYVRARATQSTVPIFFLFGGSSFKDITKLHRIQNCLAKLCLGIHVLLVVYRF